MLPLAPLPKPVPVPLKNNNGEIPEALANICSIEAALASHVPPHEQPPTFFELLGLDPYSQPFSPPSSSARRGAAGEANAAVVDRWIKEAWLWLAKATDKTYISVQGIGDGSATASEEKGLDVAVRCNDVRLRVKLDRLTVSAEAKRRLYNQVARLLLDGNARSIYMHYFMPGEQLYKDEVKKDSQNGWVHNRRGKLRAICS
ncbi:hypothetical protein CSUB01_09123 [Colletotrichum sublineola]|uniref:Uncharacterized protein n=1 Tax=Colletotrichum sublineola TaxID=1173701 RepID=A0A066XMV2_COLSU|nr:hypothetical protein CSUB01_09123 [Colletotrichum sublineola]